MNLRTWCLVGLVALGGSAANLAPLACARDPMPNIADAGSHVGTFVSASGNEFTMKSDTGEMHRHTLAADAMVTDPNGKPCRITDLKAGQKIQVTTEEGRPNIAKLVECIV